MIFHCCDPRRREFVRAHATLGGLDFLEVLDSDAPPGTPRQRTLLLRFLGPAPALARENFALIGGERVTGIGIDWVTRADAPDASLIGPAESALPGFLTALPEAENVLALRTDSSGDYATYTLRLVAGPGALGPPPGLDRVLSEVEFSFKVECGSDFDCAPRSLCPEEPPERPAISYLAKDYRSFRAEHDLTVSAEDLGAVPEPHLQLVPEPTDDPCARPEPAPVPPRFRPVLAESPVTQAAPWSADSPPASASAALAPPLDARRPAVTLTGTAAGATRGWEARRDLLQSFPADPHFVVETERDGHARLRFGDDRNGRRPASGTRFTGDYRLGNGAAGNLGVDALHHVITAKGGVVGVRNPLPGRGGTEPESMQEVREAAPYAYRRQERAVTPDDYASVARRHPDVQRAAATFRWNGHGHTVFVTVDRLGGRPVTPAFEDDLREFLERFRMAGYDLEIDAPRFVAIELGLSICVGPDHFRSAVQRAVLDRLGSGRHAEGRTGFFHPDNFTFADPLYLSAIYAAVMAIDGVSSTHATLFRRRGRREPAPLRDGVIETGRLEIVQLANDPNFPERGSIELRTEGGK